MEKADDCQADLIVVGSRSRSAVGRLLIGSVSKQIATESRRSVLVARHVVQRGDAAVQIIIGVDGSPGAEAAARAVRLREWPDGTKVRAIAVDDTIGPTGTATLVTQAASWVRERHEERLASARTMMERTSHELRTTGLEISSALIHGSPQRILCNEARRLQADCIFVGTRGFGSALERFRTGSVSTALVTSAPCSVEVVRTQPPE
jgi:nucleotide-binding universal stress UspA family protein